MTTATLPMRRITTTRRPAPAQSFDDAALLDELRAGDESGRHTFPVPPWSPRAEDVLAREETRAQVRACIDRLPESYRTVLLLRDIEALDTEEAARALGTTPGAVKVSLHRARQALRRLLEPVMAGGQAVNSLCN